MHWALGMCCRGGKGRTQCPRSKSLTLFRRMRAQARCWWLCSYLPLLEDAGSKLQLWNGRAGLLLWHSSWWDSAVSPFHSEVKTTCVRVHLLFTGPLDNHKVPTCPVQGENWVPAHLYPKLLLADHLLGQALCTAWVTQISSCRDMGGIAALKPP